ncbi:MAG: FG-GAP-like repeat-containing protein [Candidatus Eisenbacteria bacterium]
MSLAPRLAIALCLLAVAASLASTPEAAGPYPCRTDLIEVLFTENAKVRLRDGAPVDLAGDALAGVDGLLADLERHSWRRLCDVPEETLDEWQTRGEAETRESVYNLNNIYRLRIPRGSDVWEIAARLEALPGVLSARPMPLPTPLPTPPNYNSYQGYLRPAGSTPTGIDADYAWTQTGGTGNNVRVCDIEYSWNYNHADITKAVGSQINPNTILDPFGSDNHGTAVIGELVANNNGWGTTGICYGAGLKTCGSYFIVPGPPVDTTWDVPAAIGYAIAGLSAGDVILLEQQWNYYDPNTAQPDYIPIEWWTNVHPNPQSYNGVYAAIVNAVANGINVVEAGGNGGEVAGSGVNTDNLVWYGNSGAIVVGAGGAYAGGTWVEGDLERLSFSSHGQRFDLQGWGENVATTGYGDLYLSEGPNYYYTANFSGTSSASPIVAGAVACCVGRWKAAVSASPPSPSYIRSLLKSTGTPQYFGLSGNIGPRPNLQAAFGQMGLGWSDATSGPLGDTGNGASVAWGDYDNDGDLDIYHGRSMGLANKLFRNDGGGTFVDATTGPLGDTGDHNGCVFGDYDNDGDLDLFLAKTNAQADKLLRNDGGGAFADVSTPLFNDLGNGASAAWADYDNDGDLDVFVANAQGAAGSSVDRLYRNDSGTFVDATHGPLLTPRDSEGVAFGDYDNDGDLDLYVSVYTNQNRLFRNDNGVFADVTTAPLNHVGTGIGVAWGDYDNDGDLDLYLCNGTAAYPNRLFRNNGNGTFTDVTAAPLDDTSPSYSCVWADFDNDGDLDLYVSNVGAANKLFSNQGNGTFTDATTAPLGDTGSGIGVAAGDYDADGDLDLYLANYGPTNRLFRNEGGSAKHWIHVVLLGSVSNRSGIGARVRLVSSMGAQMREINAGSGHDSQDSPAAEFGLGSVVSADTIAIRWPSGIVTVLTNVAADQVVLVSEAQTSVAEGALPASARPRLHANAPNPFNPSTTVRFDLPGEGPATLSVYDVSGRLVTTLFSERSAGGSHARVWNGRNERGMEVAAGIYLLRLQTPDETAVRKITLVK